MIFLWFEVLTAVSMKIALMMEPVRTSETSENLHQSARRYNPQNSHLQCFYYMHIMQNLTDLEQLENVIKRK
jgi:hypothetical protein